LLKQRIYRNKQAKLSNSLFYISFKKILILLLGLLIIDNLLDIIRTRAIR